jgi:galactitol PTS system EIIA component
MKLDAQLMFPGIAPANRDDLFATVGAALLDRGFVKDTYLDALTQREASHPTGLLVAGGGVAIPHTDANHAAGDTIAVATLTSPVTFAPMGGVTDEPIEVSTVIFLVLTEGPRHLTALSKVVKAIQDPVFLGELHTASTAAELAELFGQKLGPLTPDTL